MMYHKLKFLNPVGLTSENFSTVRIGTKWAERTVPESAEERVSVELVDGNGRSLGTAVCKGAWTGPLSQVPALLLECSHDPVLRTWSGVAQSLAGIYNDSSVGYETIVTVLQLQYTGSIIKLAGLN